MFPSFDSAYVCDFAIGVVRVINGKIRQVFLITVLSHQSKSASTQILYGRVRTKPGIVFLSNMLEFILLKMIFPWSFWVHWPPQSTWEHFLAGCAALWLVNKRRATRSIANQSQGAIFSTNQTQDECSQTVGQPASLYIYVFQFRFFSLFFPPLSITKCCRRHEEIKTFANITNRTNCLGEVLHDSRKFTFH